MPPTACAFADSLLVSFIQQMTLQQMTSLGLLSIALRSPRSKCLKYPLNNLNAGFAHLISLLSPPKESPVACFVWPPPTFRTTLLFAGKLSPL